MNTPNNNIEKCRRLISELRWNERNVAQSARIAVSKALWLGIERDEVLQLIRSVPSATYLRQYPHILTQTWATIAEVGQSQTEFTELDQLLNALN